MTSEKLSAAEEPSEWLVGCVGSSCRARLRAIAPRERMGVVFCDGWRNPVRWPPMEWYYITDAKGGLPFDEGEEL